MNNNYYGGILVLFADDMHMHTNIILGQYTITEISSFDSNKATEHPKSGTYNTCYN